MSQFDINMNNIKRPILIPAGFLLLLLLIAFFYILYLQEMKNTDEKMFNLVNSTEQAFLREIDKKAFYLSSQKHFFNDNACIMSAWTNKDIEQLKTCNNMIVKQLQHTFELRNLNYISTDKKHFFQIAIQDTHTIITADQKSHSFITQKALNTRSSSYGIELSSYCTLELRMTFPISFDSKIIAYVEIVTDILEIIQSLEDDYDISLFVLLEKQCLINNKMKHDSLEEYSNLELPPWDFLDQHVLLYGDDSLLSDANKKYLDKKRDINEKKFVNFEEQGYYSSAGYFYILNSSGIPIGHFGLISDNTVNMMLIYSLLLRFVIFYIIFSSLLLLLFYHYVNRLEKQLNTSFQSLNNEVFERKQAEQRAEFANQSKTDFLANMSHEIRTPLNGILGLTELVLDTKLTEQQRENLKTVFASGETLLTILNDILDLSKMEAGKFDLNYCEFSPNEIIEYITKLYSKTAHKQGIELISNSISGLTHHPIGDPDRLQQVLINLLSNAIKFTHQGEVVLSVKMLYEDKNKMQLRFSVQDTGIGISIDEQHKLFEKFSQIDSSYSRKYGGTGLGLSIAHKLIKLMGGKIIVQSEPGKGSLFWFEIELKKGSVLTNNQSETKPLLATHIKRTEKVLLVEDVEINRQVAIGMLNKLGLTDIDIAYNGLQAVEKFSCGQYALILMDLQMPEMDGYAATTKIREIEKIKQQGCGKQNCFKYTSGHYLKPCSTIIIALTAHAFSDEKDKCIAMGLDYLITKPLTKVKLAEVLNQWLPMKDLIAVEQECPETKQVELNNEKSDKLSSLDETILRNLHHDMGGSIGAIIDLYIKELPAQIEEICQAIESKNSEVISTSSHRLKGTSRNIGTLYLAELCETLDKKITQIDNLDIEQMCKSLRKEEELVIKAFSEDWIKEVR